MIGKQHVDLIGILELEFCHASQCPHGEIAAIDQVRTMDNLMQDEMVVGAFVECCKLDNALEVPAIIVQIAGYEHSPFSWQMDGRSLAVGTVEIGRRRSGKKERNHGGTLQVGTGMVSHGIGGGIHQVIMGREALFGDVTARIFCRRKAESACFRGICTLRRVVLAGRQ